MNYEQIREWCEIHTIEQMHEWTSRNRVLGWIRGSWTRNFCVFVFNSPLHDHNDFMHSISNGDGNPANHCAVKEFYAHSLDEAGGPVRQMFVVLGTNTSPKTCLWIARKWSLKTLLFCDKGIEFGWASEYEVKSGKVLDEYPFQVDTFASTLAEFARLPHGIVFSPRPLPYADGFIAQTWGWREVPGIRKFREGGRIKTP